MKKLLLFVVLFSFIGCHKTDSNTITVIQEKPDDVVRLISEWALYREALVRYRVKQYKETEQEALDYIQILADKHFEQVKLNEYKEPN